ncbi:MAG TPA: hypothetical protein PLK06_03105, partial [bacterium]|nr:hypothetical protein [bacterium]
IPDEAPSSGPWGSVNASPELTATVDIQPGKYDVEVYWINANGKQTDTYVFSEVEFLDFNTWSQLENKAVWEYPDQE